MTNASRSQPGTLVRQRDAAELAAGYSTAHRLVELAGVSTFAIGSAWNAWSIGQHAGSAPFAVAAGVLSGMLASDLISGLVHWFCDTWGSPEWPVVGPYFIRTFREHHVDDKAITRHGFLETNGANCVIGLLPVLWTLLVPFGHDRPWALYVATTFWSLGVFTAFTGQIHKWSHQDHPKRWVQVLQRTRLILPVDHHAEHHRAPYAKNYCITLGWFNGPLEWVGFFRAAERLITAVTGAIPRADDIGKEAAVVVVAAQEAEAARVQAENEDAARLDVGRVV